MSLIDFTQKARYQGCLHVVVHNLTKDHDVFYEEVLGALQKLPPIQLTEHKDTVLFLRFLDNSQLPSWASNGHRWSEFSPYKQLLGVLCICKCHDLDDLANSMAGFKTLSTQYKQSTSGLCETRCVIYGPKPELEGAITDTIRTHHIIDTCHANQDIKHSSLSEVVMEFALGIRNNIKSRITACEKSLTVPKLLRSPFEPKENNSLVEDLDTKTLANARLRNEKHIADLCLLAGDLQSAWFRYRKIVHQAQRDTLWFASINESLAATAIIIQLWEDVKGQKLQNVSSSEALFSWKHGGSNRSSGRYPSTSSGADSSAKAKTLSMRRISNTSNGELALDNGEGYPSDEEGSKEEDEAEEGFINDKFNTALKSLIKLKAQGSVCYIEAALKYTRLLIDQKRYCTANEQLQKIVKLDVSFNTKEKAGLYCTLADLCQQMGFKRKASLFSHFAARWASVIAKSPEDFRNAHEYILKALPGYKLSQHFSDLPANNIPHKAWPLLQAQVLKDFVFLSKKHKDSVSAINHSCYLLQFLAGHLSSEDLKQVTEMLTDISKETSAKSQFTESLATFSLFGKLCSPLPLEQFPSRKSISLVDVPELKKPIKIEGFVPASAASALADKSPFIYSPYEAKRKKQRPEVLWVVGDPGEILLIIENTLPFELRVTDMSIHIEGSQVEIFPISLTLPPKSEPQDIKLLTVPTEPGLLDVKGYEATVFGIRYECKVKIPGNLIVHVVPPLPEVRLRLFRMGSDQCPMSPIRDPGFKPDKNKSSQLVLLDGEICEWEFQLECVNKQQVDVDYLSVSVSDYDKDYCSISWDETAVNSLLPITKGDYKSFYVTVCAKSPAWDRVLNEHTQGISKTTVFPHHQEELQESMLEVGHSHSASTTPVESPTSSPIAKRSNIGSRSSLRKPKRSSLSEYSLHERTLMESLDLHISDVPGLNAPRVSNSLPRIRQTHKRNTSIGDGGTLGRFKRGSKRNSGDIPDLDSLKRMSQVSTRSDPGDREEKKRTKTVVRGPEASKSIQVPRSTVNPPSNSSQLFNEPSIPSSLQSRSAKTSIARAKQLTQITKGSISVPMGPLIREKHKPKSKQEINCEFKVSYSGGLGLKEGYCRECKAQLPVTVRPSLVFERFEVSSVQTNRAVFSLKFSVQNVSKKVLNTTLSVDKVYDANEEESVTMNLDHNALKEASLIIKRFVIPEAENSEDLAKDYSEKLGEIVRVEWSVRGSAKKGVVNFGGLRLPTASVSLMRPAPLMFGFSIGGQVLPVQDSYNQECNAGSQIKLVVSLTNSSGLKMPPSFILFDPSFHCQQKKSLVKDVQHMILHSGSLIVNVPELQPDMVHKHELAMTFLRKGKYLLEIKSYTQVSGQHVTTQVSPPNLTLAPSPTSSTAVVNNTSGLSLATTAQPSIPSQESPKSKACSEPTSPKASPVSPNKAPRNVTSPDSTNKALQMAKMYEARVAFRDKTVYKGSLAVAKKVPANELSTSESEPLIESKETFLEETTDMPVLSDSKKTPKVELENLSTLLNKFSLKDSIVRVAKVSPVPATTNTPSPPPLPRGYHGEIKPQIIDRASSTSPDNGLIQFKKLLKLQSENSSSIRVIIGPQFTFSVS